MLVTSGDGEKKRVYEKHEGDANGESILSGFGSSSGSSTDETSEQEEFLDELTRQMAENMLQEEEEKKPISSVPKNNKHKTTRFVPNNVLQNQQGKKYGHQNQQQREVKEYGDGSRRAGFLSSALPNGSGMRMVFLGGTGSRNGSAGGTGVFIPHATNTLPDHQARKKPGRCSTVLIPDRVLQSLKQHHEKRNANQAHPNAASDPHQNQRLQVQESSSKTVVKKNNNNNDDDDKKYEDLQLPQEWTY